MATNAMKLDRLPGTGSRWQAALARAWRQAWAEQTTQEPLGLVIAAAVVLSAAAVLGILFGGLGPLQISAIRWPLAAVVAPSLWLGFFWGRSVIAEYGSAAAAPDTGPGSSGDQTV